MSPVRHRWGKLIRSLPVAIVIGCTVLLADTRSATSEPLRSAFDSVVSVLPDWPPDVRRVEEPEGSGVVLIDGHTIVTTAHVINKARRIRVRTHDGRILDAKPVASDVATDIAVLTIKESLPVLSSQSKEPEFGQDACAIGNAFGLGLSLTCGVISGIHRAGVGFNRIEDFVQTDAAVNPGASGGALVTRDGAFIGLLSAIFTKKSDANIGVNFAVAATLVERVARELKESGKVAWVNMGLRMVRAPEKGKTGRLGARVRAVRPGLPAAVAGVLAGDIVVKAGERQIRKPSDLTSALASLAPSVAIELVVERDGREKTLTLKY